MRKLIDRIPPIFKSFYFLAFSFFLIWIVFFDSNDVLTQARLSKQQKELIEARKFYEQRIEEVKGDREALLSDQELLEKLAREKYFMKKENEDVFVVVED